MVRMLFLLIIITLLVFYVPDNTRQELKNIITSINGSVHKLVKENFPERSDKLKYLFSQARYENTRQVDSTLEQKQINECFEKTDGEEDSKDTVDGQEPSIDTEHFRTFYKINRDKLIELMNILGEPSNDKKE